MQKLGEKYSQKTTIVPSQFTGSRIIPKDINPDIPLSQSEKASPVNKIDNRRKENPRNESKAFKIDKELDLILLDLMEEYEINSDSEMIYRLLETHPLIASHRHKTFIEENPQYNEIFSANHKEFLKDVLKHKNKKSLERKRASRI